MAWTMTYIIEHSDDIRIELLKVPTITKFETINNGIYGIQRIKHIKRKTSNHSILITQVEIETCIFEYFDDNGFGLSKVFTIATSDQGFIEMSRTFMVEKCVACIFVKTELLSNSRCKVLQVPFSKKPQMGHHNFVRIYELYVMQCAMRVQTKDLLMDQNLNIPFLRYFMYR